MTTNLIGKSLGRYHILEQLGEGGMAIVYKAYDTRLERDVAIKVIRTEKLTQESMGKSLKRFEREAKSLAKLSHANIIPIIDSGEQDDVPYLVMGYIPGGTLKERMKGKPIPWQEAAQFLAPIARALDYAHSEGIVHRDIKPSNILITKEDQPMLTDFGIARILETEETLDLTGTGMGVGTPDYMAPEQGLGQKVDHRADVYALGIVLYEMVTGRKPFQADTPMAVVVKQIHDPLPRPTEFAPDLPDAIEHVLLKALAKKPEDRYQKMGAFATALENPGTKERRRWKNPFATRSMVKTWRWLFGLFLFAGIVGAGMFFQRQGNSFRSTEATMDPAKAIQIVRNMTWTAQVNSQATATQNRSNYLATQTIKALTPTSTPLPTATATQLSAEYRIANEILQIVENREPDYFYDFNLGNGPWISDAQYDSMVYKYNVLMWEPLEDRYSWANGPGVNKDFAWAFDIRLTEIGGDNPLFGFAFGGSWDTCTVYTNGQTISLDEFYFEESKNERIFSNSIPGNLLPTNNWKRVSLLYLDQTVVIALNNEIINIGVCDSTQFPVTLKFSGHNTIKVEIDNVGIWDISDQSGKVAESLANLATPQLVSTESISSIPALTAKLDGNPEEWEGIQPVLVDQKNDSLVQTELELSSVYVAKDDKYIYGMFEGAVPFSRSIQREAALRFLGPSDDTCNELVIHEIALNTKGDLFSHNDPNPLQYSGAQVVFLEALEFRIPLDSLFYNQCQSFELTSAWINSPALGSWQSIDNVP